jgi:hypothetical protein
MDSPLLNERQKHAVLWAEHVTKNTARSDDDVFNRVAKVFEEEEIVELTFVSAYFNFRNRFMDSLNIPVDITEGEDAIKTRTVQANPDKLKGYLQFVIDNWPDEFPEPNPDE